MASFQMEPMGERSLGPLVETSAQIQRTMVVGLGGTGGEVIKRLKRRLRRQGQANSYIRFVSLDTDLRSGLATIQFPALEPRERVPLHYPNPENVLESPHLYPTIQHLFHQGKRVDISLLADGTGAGLMPVVGRTALHLNAGAIYGALQRALKDLQAIPTQPGGQPLTEEFRIYVVGSVAGGTGAGCIIDAAVLIRHVFSQFKYQLIGILALPEAFVPTLRGQQLDAQSRGNAYAVLKELQYLQDGMTVWTDPDTYTFQYQLGGDVRTIILRERPFDIVYLVDNQNQQGGALRNLTDIYEMISQQLSVEIGSPFGAKFASAQANERAIRGLAPCPETRRPANISSLATAALVVPEEKLLRYCSRRYLSEVIRSRLLGEAPGARQAEQAAAAWLLAADLEERGNHRMISRALLTDLKEDREVTGGEYALDAESMITASVPEFLGAAGNQEDHFESVALPAIRSLIDRNVERLRAEIPGRVASMLAESQSGVRGALAARAAVEREVQAMAAELAARQNDDEAVRTEISDQLADRHDELEGRAGWLGGLFGKRKEQMRAVARLQADLFQIELDMAARAGALRTLESLRTQLDEQRRRLEALESHLTRLQQTVDAELTQEQWAPDLGSTYALETEAIRAEHFPAYYDRFRPSAPEAFLKAMGDLTVPAEYPVMATRLAQAARALFADHIQSLNVVEVLQELYDRTYAFSLLDDLARRCQPFWTATPRGACAFSDVFLIGSPGYTPAGPGAPVHAEPFLQEWLDQHAGGSALGIHSEPTYVALGSPGAIIFSRQTHGARLHYMRQILDYQEQYRMLQQQRGYPVHFKPCLEALPELRPDDEKATECWALGVAYGMIAAKMNGWVWAFDTEQRKDPEAPGGYRTVEFLCTGSIWDLAAEIAPVEKNEVPAYSSRFLHATRSGALGQFGQRRDYLAAVEQMVGRRLEATGKQALGAELTRYLEETLARRMKRADEMEAATLTREHGAIRRFIERINL
ncbi:MAG TPA: tubulin-like doman-containing protein [Symbiobacteriaceae bacterium]|nr:tubulin-like doman-containing protein [Symbiobacteriaceae bacterium]